MGTELIRGIFAVALLALGLAGCAHQYGPPVGADPQAFSAPTDRAVIFVVRSNPDIGELPGTIAIGDTMLGTTHPGTYIRAEVVPGRHTLRGYGVDTGNITVDARPGQIIYIQQRVLGTWRVASPRSVFQVISEQQARAVIARASRVG